MTLWGQNRKIQKTSIKNKKNKNYTSPIKKKETIKNVKNINWHYNKTSCNQGRGRHKNYLNKSTKKCIALKPV